MKRLVLFALLISVTGILSAQRDRLDAFFAKYEGNDGYTTVTINGDLLGFLSEMDDDPDLDRLANRITSIRIISTERDVPHPGVNFYSELHDDIRKGGYEEMVTVKDSDDDVLILVRTTGNIIKEVLILASGECQTVIQIKGTLHDDDLEHLSRSHIDGLEYLEELENSGK